MPGRPKSGPWLQPQGREDAMSSSPQDQSTPKPSETPTPVSGSIQSTHEVRSAPILVLEVEPHIGRLSRGWA